MKISVVIPVLNEETNIKSCIASLHNNSGGLLAEIIIVDGGSTDKTVEVCQSLGCQVFYSDIKSRAAQMNLGASKAIGNVLYFVHADTRVFPGYDVEILNSLKQHVHAGCFRYRFDSKKIMLRINSWFTRFNGALAGGGDQSLFIKKRVFRELDGFDEKFCIMEDFDLTRRIKAKYKFVVVPKAVKVSARKYEHNSWLRVQLVNLYMVILFKKDTEPAKIKHLYAKLLNYR